MPHPYVTSAKFAGGQMTFSVLVSEFQDDKEPEYVEISGYATQTGGAFANIYNIAKVLPKVNGKSDPELSVDVTVTPGPDKPFRIDQDVTVGMRVAKVWVTVLGINQDTTGVPVGATIDPSQPPNDGTTWDNPTEVAEMYGSSSEADAS